MSPSRFVDTAKAVLARTKQDNVTLLASATAFWGMLALVPGLVALVSVYGLVADPADVERQVREATEALPEEARALVISQLRAVVDAPRAGLGTGLVVGVALALFSASAGVGTLSTAVGVIYGDEAADRGAVKERGKALVLTLGATVLGAVAVYLVAVAPSGDWLAVIRWPVLGVLLLLGLGTLYRLGPVRRPDPRLVSPGSLAATGLCIAVTLLFSLYTSTLGDYNETYGSLGAVVVLLIWLQLTGIGVLLGAELNQVLAGRTAPRALS
jgi:membrane protein